jgi:hypothetical protein
MRTVSAAYLPPSPGDRVLGTRPRRSQAGARGSFECGVESLDGTPVDLAAFCELRKVVVARVNHTARNGRTFAQALEIRQVTAMHLGARGGK